MHRLRLLLLLGLVFAVGGTPLAKAQDATSGLDQYKTVPPDTKQDKAKTKDQNNDGHRKHWWSLPHLRHKKHESESAARPAETNSSSRTVAAKPVNKTVAAKPMNKTAVHTHPGNRTARATRPVHKTVARTGQGKKTVAKTYPHKKVIARTSHGKKTVRHGCTPAEAKKGGCQAYKAHSQKGTSAS